MVWIKVIFTFKHGGVCPGEEIFEYGARVVEVFCPTSPGTDVTEGPAEHHGKILTTPPTEGMSAVGPRINVDITEVVMEAVQE